MLQIKCDHCGQILKGKDVVVTKFMAQSGGVEYKDYACSCPKCGGSIEWDRYTQKGEENKAKALVKLSLKTGKSVKRLTEEEKYNVFMRQAYAIAKQNAAKDKEIPIVKARDMLRAIKQMPDDTKQSMLEYEDKLDMALLKSGSKKPTEHVKPNAILLLTQAIIARAIVDKDEDFFRSEYGAQVCDTYNLALTAHTGHDNGITAAILLKKMQQGEIKVRGEE